MIERHGPYPYGFYRAPKRVFENGAPDWHCWLWLTAHCEAHEYNWRMNGRNWWFGKYGDFFRAPDGESYIWFDDVEKAVLYDLRWHGII